MAIAKVYFDADMRLGIDGLTELIKAPIKPSDFYMFLNKRQNYLKILWSGQYILLYRKESGKITIDEIKAIPSFFKGNFVTSKIEQVLEKQLKSYVKLIQSA